MEPDRRNRITDLYHAALRLAPEERAAFMNAACDGDEALRQEVESLLAVECPSSPFLERPAMDVIARGPASLIGRRVGCHELVAPLGAGGMGEVYRARDTRLGRDVAIKILPAHFTADPERRARFAREARVLATLNHPHIGAIYGLEDADGLTALVLELVEGPTLADCLERGPLPLAQALAVARDVADALEAAHQKNIVHRDLKPANVVAQGWTAGSKTVSGDPRAKVLDFGLAKLIAAEGNEDQGTRRTDSIGGTVQGRILGTPAYMSPEQARGESVDKRTDIWAFGCVLFEMLTGRVPLEGKTVSDTLAAVLEHEPPWARLPETTPETVRRLLRRCLEKDHARRLRDIGDARLEIEEAATQLSLASVDSLEARGSAGAARRLDRSRLRERVAWSLSAVLALAAASAILFQSRSVSAPLITPKQFAVRLPNLRYVVPEGRGFSLVPDGSAIVYLAATPEDGWRIHLYTMADGVSRALGGTERALLPTVSPDGKWVAFYRSNRLMKVAITGGPPIEVSAVPYLFGISWSRDDWIVFATGSGLARVPAAGGEAQTLTTLQADEFRHVSPHVLPDGKAVLFTAISRSGTMEDAAICVVSVSTGERRTLLKGAADARYSPTGHLLYARQTDLLGVSFDADRLRVVSSTPFLVVASIHIKPQQLAGSFDLARDGTLAWVASGPSTRTLVWTDRSGVKTALPIPALPYIHPALMPDERSAIVEIEATPHNLWHLDLTSGALTRLTHEGPNHRPVVRQDGRFFVFSSDRTTPRSLFRLSTDGSGAPERLVNATSEQNVTSWSADGRWLAFTQTTPATRDDIWVLSLDAGSTPRPFLQTSSSEYEATFSPDVRWMAYTTDESGRKEVVVQSFPGDGPRKQVSTTGGETPAFSGDGRTLFFRVKDQLWAARISTDAVLRTDPPSLAFDLSGVPGSDGLPNYVVTRKGDRVLAVQNLGEETLARDIHVVVNWFDSVRRPSGLLRESPEPAK